MSTHDTTAKGSARKDVPSDHDPTTHKAGGPKRRRGDGARNREVLKERGLRYSRPRDAILDYLFEKDRHFSAETLYVELKQRGEDLSLSTVYLNLAALAEAELVREYRTPAGQSFYDSNVAPHYHVVCRETGEVVDIPAPKIDGVPLGKFLKAYAEELTGWEVDEPRLSLTGLSGCSASAAHDEGPD